MRFLQTVLPDMGLRWRGFRRVRGQVRKRLRRRLASLGLDLQAYAEVVARDHDERAALDAMCRITISRFFRDREVFRLLGETVLPGLARTTARGRLRVWSAGCASGEEPYSLAMLWQELAQGFPGVTLEVTATDAGAHMLERARAAVYAAGSLREVDADRQRRWFVADGALLRLRPEVRGAVTFLEQDIRGQAPDCPRFDLVLCRNLAFTYFDEPTQGRVLARIQRRLHPDGVLVIGGHEALPGGVGRWRRLRPGAPIYQQEVKAPGSVRARP